MTEKLFKTTMKGPYRACGSCGATAALSLGREKKVLICKLCGAENELPPEILL